MLNNYPGGENASQNAYGLYDDNLQPKIAAYALAALTRLNDADPPGAFSDSPPTSRAACASPIARPTPASSAA